MTKKDDLDITIEYRGENGDGWVPKSARDLWNYAVRTGQVVLPPTDDGDPPALCLNRGDRVSIDWIPPEYEGRLRTAPPPPQPTHFEIAEATDA